MSYDLYCHKKLDADVTQTEIKSYMTENIGAPNEDGQWWYTNEDTGVYFVFEPYSDDDDPTDAPSGFESVGITFSINLIRPDFFGLEAFPFVDRFLAELDLHVLDPQDETAATPTRPDKGKLYKNWSRSNIQAREAIPDDVGLYSYPRELSNALWQHNFNRAAAQEELGDDYFVPDAMCIRLPGSSQAAFITTWTQHIPTVLPPVDYVVLIRQYKKFFRTVTDQGVVSYANLMAALGKYFEPYTIEGSSIIHPANAEKAEKIFNSIKFDHSLDNFREGLSVDLITDVM